MTKIYEGAGLYTIHLSSGKTLELTDDEIKEIIEDDTDKIQKAKEAIDAATNLLEDILEERE